MRDVLPDLERWQTAGERIALATVVSVAGSAPRGIGAVLAVSERGEISGSVSGGCVEPAVIEDGMRAIRSGRPKLLKFGITEEQNVEQIGLSCGGEIRVFVERADDARLVRLERALREDEPVVRATVIAASGEAARLVGGSLVIVEGDVVGTLEDAALQAAVTDQARTLLRGGDSAAATATTSTGETVEVFYDVHLPPPTLVIVGAGHVSIPLTRIAKVLGYKVIVMDAREAFATRERLPEADELLVEWPDEALDRLRLTSATAVAVLTHDNKFDVPALKVALNSPAFYVGAIGSRGTREQRDARLRDEGITPEQIGTIYGPIGLNIGAQTPEEIALAIMAQIVAVRRGHADTGARAHA
jgi:xanthine dehydrogenase accessory factor